MPALLEFDILRFFHQDCLTDKIFWNEGLNGTQILCHGLTGSPRVLSTSEADVTDLSGLKSVVILSIRAIRVIRVIRVLILTPDGSFDIVGIT